MKIIIIAAVAKNRVIGKGNKIPWHSKEDFKHFREVTTGNLVLMGRKTYESMGKALSERKNVVISSRGISLPDAEVFDGYDKALQFSKEYAVKNNCNIFIIGGASIYEIGLKDADEIHISNIKGDFEGDVFFPNFTEKGDWLLDSEKEFNDFVLSIWKRKNIS